jgi:DNA-nicking Smr family endonuclease
VNFGDILDKWEDEKRRGSQDSGKKEEYRALMNGWLDEKGAPPKEDDLHSEGRKSPARKTLRRMAPQDSLDLHGYTVNEALAELEGYLKRCRRRGLRKVLIIHGKGNHSEDGESVLRREVRRYLRESPLCGECGIPQPALGGEGAVWVILR